MEKTTRDIPDDVYDHARDLQDSGLYEAAFEHIAAWARNEALREAADAIDSLDGSRAQGYYASEAHSGYQEAQRDAEAAIRALAEGGA